MGEIGSRRRSGKDFNFACVSFYSSHPLPGQMFNFLFIEHLSYLMDFGCVIYPLETHFLSSNMFSLSWQNRSYGLALTG